MVMFIIFGVGVFVTLMTLGGLLYTILEVRHLSNHPENYRPPKSIL